MKLDTGRTGDRSRLNHTLAALAAISAFVVSLLVTADLCRPVPGNVPAASMLDCAAGLAGEAPHQAGASPEGLRGRSPLSPKCNFAASHAADQQRDYLEIPGLLRIHLGIAATAHAAPAPNFVPDTAPWINVNRHFGAAIRTGRVVPITPNPDWKIGQTLKDGGVYMVSGDLPGWTRSIDGGERFESAVSGRTSSKNICGGYGQDWYGVPIASSTGEIAWNCSTSKEKDWCDICTAAASDAALNREWAEAGPPSSLIAFRGAAAGSGRDVASGPRPAALDDAKFTPLCRGPANEPGCAKSILYTANDWWSFFSPDAGRQWFRLTPQCEMSTVVGWGGFAADRGLKKPTGADAQASTDATAGGHVVGFAMRWTDTPGPTEASGCLDSKAEPKQCATRSIAWTDDVGPELAESMLATSGDADAWKGKSRTERAGGGGADLSQDAVVEGTDQSAGAQIAAWAKKAKWRYATINHLPAPAKIGGTCRVFQGENNNSFDADAFEASIPSASCQADPASRCHGRRAQTKKQSTTAVADRDAWCPDYSSAACKCTNGPVADCRYPDPTSLEIDPRNGWSYLSTDVGLLSSPSGGRSWIRQGGKPAANDADVFQKMVALDTYMPDTTILGAKLYTKQYHCDLVTDPNCVADPTSENSLDLNANPDRITFVGRVSLQFKPCAEKAYYAPVDGKPARRRGHIAASVAAEWQVEDGLDTAGNKKYRRVSSVFVALDKDDCDETSTPQEPGGLVFWDTAHLELKSTVQDHPDLNDYNFRARTYFGGDKPKLLRNLPLLSDGKRLRYTAAAVAPSDPRVIWAFSYGLVKDTADVATADALGHLLWRSLDGGATWRIALPARGIWPARALRGGGGIQNAKVPELSIAPTNPHKVMLGDSSRASTASGADEAWIAEPVPPAEVLAPGVPPEADCSACGAKSARVVARSAGRVTYSTVGRRAATRRKYLQRSARPCCPSSSRSKKPHLCRAFGIRPLERSAATLLPQVPTLEATRH